MYVNNQSQIPLEIIRGVIIPADWDSDGRVLAVSISAFDENEYSVIDDDNGRELLAFVRETVIAEGLVSKTGEVIRIQIKRYKIFTQPRTESAALHKILAMSPVSSRERH
jgi:hypothetical protein